MLEHPDRADRVEWAVGNVTIVLQPYLDRVLESRGGDGTTGVFVLGARDRDPHGANAVVLGRVDHHATPPTADIEQAHPWRQPQLAAHQFVLVLLCLLERVVVARERRAGVGHRWAEHQSVELVGHVVVVAYRCCVAALRVAAKGHASAGTDLLRRWWRRVAQDVETDRTHHGKRGTNRQPGVLDSLLQVDRQADVALDINRPRNVRARQAQFSRRPKHVGEGIRRSDSDPHRRIDGPQ